MRRAAKIDKNQREIVEALRRIGASVQSLAAVGEGCPDLLVGLRGANYLFEVKDGTKPPSRRKLTQDQVLWHALWGGQVTVVDGLDDALAAIGVGQGHRRRR